MSVGIRPRMGRKAATPPPKGSPGERIRKLMESLPESRQLSVNEVAARASLSPSRLSDILNGKSLNPGVQTVERILMALGKTFCDYHKAGK